MMWRFAGGGRIVTGGETLAEIVAAPSLGCTGYAGYGPEQRRLATRRHWDESLDGRRRLTESEACRILGRAR